MALDIARIITAPPKESVVLSIPCPNSYFAYPCIKALHPIPTEVFLTLDRLWARSIHVGLPVNIYRFCDVYVVKEGLVFDKNAKLIDVTKTYHEDGAILSAWHEVRQMMNSQACHSTDKGILAKSRGSSNYGHFLVEMLPRAWLARTRLDLNGWPAIIDSTSAAVQTVSTQALIQAGFAPNEVIGVGPEPLFVKELIVVDGLTSHTRYMSPIVMQSLDAISENVPAASDKKVYTPRRPVVGREFEQERDIAARLESIGFVEKATAEMTFIDQVATFKGADSIVAVAGAALTNLVFCRPGTEVFSFSPCGAAEVLFWMISESRRLRYIEIRCEEIGCQIGGLPWDKNIRITPDQVEHIISKRM